MLKDAKRQKKTLKDPKRRFARSAFGLIRSAFKVDLILVV